MNIDSLFSHFVWCYLEGYYAGLLTGGLLGLLVGGVVMAIMMYRNLDE